MIGAFDLCQRIEAVQPDDTDELDALDMAVLAYVAQDKHKGKIWQIVNTGYDFTDRKGYGSTVLHKHEYSRLRFTRSMDAIRYVRPKGWEHAGTAIWYVPSLNKWAAKLMKDAKNHEPHSLAQTEELALLSSTIKAIDFERKGKWET